MGIPDLTDKEILIRMKDLAKHNDRYTLPFSQYAEEIFKRYYSQAYNIARYYGLSHDNASDVVQNAFIKAFNSISKFNTHRDFKPWFFKIVFNCIRDEYNMLKKYNYEQIDENTEISKNIFEEFHIRHQINGIISRLPEKLKKAVLLRNYADMTYESVANTLNISVRQLHNRLNRAYEIIKKKIEEEGL